MPLQAGSVTLSPTQLQAINGGLPLTDGVYVLHLRATGVEDALVTTTDLTFTLDTTTSALSDLHLTTGTGNTTNVTTPTVTGQAEVGAVVKVYGAGNVLLGQGVTDSNGSWQAMLSPLTDGTYQVTAIATDVAGNVSAASTVLSLVVDTALPTLSVTTPLTTPLVSSTRLTGTVAGTGSAIVTISYYFDERPAITLAFDPAMGTFDQALDFTDLASGAHTLTLTTIDTAGNVKTLQAPVTVALGAAPVITAALVEDTAPAGFANEDGITSNPTISGQVTTTQPLSVLRAGFGTGASVNYVDITTQLQPDGSFTLNRTQLETLYGGTLVDADYTLSLQAVDTVGNVTTPLAIAFDLDTQAPTAPSNLSLVPVGMYAVAITGTAEAGAQVQLFAGTTLIGEAVTNATGSWRVTTSQLRNGTHSLTATASDAAGNTSPATTATDVTITTLVPSTPQGLRLTALTDSGQSASDNITNIATPTIVGMAEAGATVRLFRAQQLLGETTADATTGAWSLALTTALPEGEQSLSVVAHNAIGDSQTATLLTTIDTVAPTTTQLNVLATGSTTDTALTNGMTLTTGTRLLGQVNGTTSAVASLQYQLGTSPAVTVPVAANGLFNYRLDLTGSSSGDDQMLTVTMTDVAGNTTTLAPYLVNISATNDGGGEAPVLLAQLMQDTGSNTTDGWTYIPGIAGIASAPGVITMLLATFDTATDAVFQDLSDLLQPDGTFTLDENQLAALAGGDLADGAYTLRLRVQADTNQIAEQVVSLTLDRTAPVTTLPNLIDGIAWSRDTHLQGTVVEASAGVEVAYQLETVNGVSVGSTHTLAVTEQAFNQVLDAATLTEETPYNLVLTSTDRAGNTQRSRFQFFIPGARKVTDDDAWHSQLDPLPQEPVNANNVATWGYVGAGGGWGYNSGSGGWGGGYGGSLTPEVKDAYQGGTGSGYEYEYEYAGGLAAIARNAVHLISTSTETINAKGALFNRTVLLEMLGNRVQELITADGNFKNDQALLERLSPALEGLFADAYNPSGNTAGVFASFVPWGAAWLAQGLVSDALSVRVQVFQATLLEVVTEATLGITDVNQQEALTAAVMALAKTYAWLNPNPEATVPAADKDFGFLDALWRLQIPNAITGAFKGSGDIAQTLEESVGALRRLLTGVQDPVRAIQFLNNLVQAASNVTSLKADMKEATFLRELVEFGVEVAKANPTVTIGDQTGIEEWLEILWEGNGSKQLATGGVAKFLDRPGNSQDRLDRLNYSTQLVKAVQLIDDPEVKLLAHSSAHLSYVLDLGSSYAALNPDASNVESDNSFLTLTAQGNLQNAASDLTNRLKEVLGGITADPNKLLEVPVTSTSDGRISVGGVVLESGSTKPVLWDLNDSDPSNDRYPIAYRVRRGADGPITSAVPGDTLFTFYSERYLEGKSSTDPRILYAGDTLLYPSDIADPFGEERLRNLAQENYSPLDKVFDALRLAPYTAGPTIKGQIEDFVRLITGNPLVAGVAGVTVGGIAAAQFVQPLGVILNVGLILLGGVEFGLSLASFFYKAATAKSQAELLAASQEAVYALENLLTAAPFGGLLKLDPSQGLVNTTRLLDAGKRLLRVANDIKNGRALTLADAVSIPLSLFKSEGTALGTLLQYGTDGVSEFLKGGFSKFLGDLPTIEGLKDFATRFQRVSEVADTLAKLNVENAIRWLSEKPAALRSLFDFNPADAVNTALINKLNQNGTRFTRENIIRLTEAPPEGILAVTRTGQEVQVKTPIFLEIGSNVRTAAGEDSGAGLVHILARHASQFRDRGIPEEEIADAIMKALTQGRNIGVDGTRGGRYVYQFDLDGKTEYLSIVVGDNGYIVTAFPTDPVVYNRLLQRLNDGAN